MAEDENNKRGRLATAVLAGSALAFGSFAIGAPAALAQNEADQDEQTEQASPDTATESPASEESPSATGEQDADDNDQSEAEEEDADERAGDDQASASANATSEDGGDDEAAHEDGGDFGTQEVDSDVSIDKSQVWPGDTVTVTGSGFTPDAELVINLVENDIEVSEGPQIGTVTTDSQGAFTVTVTIPEDTQPRDYNVSVYDEAEFHTFSVPLEVLDDSDVEVDPQVYTSPRSGPAGSTISISGSGYTPHGEIELSLTPTAGGDSITLDSVTANSNGMLETFEYSLPESIDRGVYVLTAVDAQSGEETTNEFNVTDVTLEVDPETIPEEDFALAPSDGGGVTHTVEGLEPGDEVDFNVGNAYNPMEGLSGSATADENGVAEYVVHDDSDSVYIGRYSTTVTLSDGTHVAQGGFEVTSEEPQASISANEVAPGEPIYLSGSNFSPDTDVTMNWDLDEPMTTQADSEGNFSHEIVVPDDAESGTYEIEITDETSGKSTTVELSVGTSDDDEPPVIEPEISLDATEAYQGEMVGLSGAGFTPNGEFELVLDSEVVSVVADENGELTDAVLQVPRDLAAGTYDVVARDLEAEGEATAELTVVEADEPALRITPEEITLDDFVRDDEDDDNGVVHTIVGLEPGADIEAVVDGPEGVQTVERDETANKNGVAEFVIYGYDLDDPTSYLGVYDTEITIVEDDADPLQGNFEVIANQDNGPSIELGANSVYPGDTLSVTGSDFTPEGDVTLEWNPTVDANVDADGNIDADLNIPEDTEPGVKELTVTDEASGDQTSAEFTVLDPADQVTEPAMSIDPEEIAVDDFMGDPEEGAGVEHAVQGVAPGSEITYVVTGPAGVNDFESSGVVNDDGTADFVIYAPETSNPNVYLGDYTSVVTYENEGGETGELQGTFTVVEGSAGSGSGESDDQAGPVGDSSDPVDLNGSDNLARTGASNVQLGLIAGLLLAVGGALVVYTNRSQLFPRKK